MTRSTSKPSPSLSSAKLAAVFSQTLSNLLSRCCCVLWQYFVKIMDVNLFCFDRVVTTLYGSTSNPSYLLRITFIQLTSLGKKHSVNIEP